MIGDEHADAPGAQLADDGLDVEHGDGIHPGKGLVHEHEGRFDDQRAGDLEPPLLAAGQGVAEIVGQVGQTELGEQPLLARLLLAFVDVQGLEHGQQVVRHGELAEHGQFLRQVGDTGPGPGGERHAGEVMLIEEDTPPVGRDETDHQVKGGRFARAVRPEQADHLAGAHLQVHPAHHPAALVGLFQSTCGQDPFVHPIRPSRRLPRTAFSAEPPAAARAPGHEP